MKFNRCALALILAAGLVMPAACNKDDDDDTTYVYMTGTLTFSMTPYVNRNETITVIPSGITDPEVPGYYWTPSWTSTNDTTRLENGSGDGRYEFDAPDSVGIFTLSVASFADGYYSSSATDTLYVVDPTLNTTVTGLEIDESDETVTDDRDGGVYYLTDVAGMTWMKNNVYYTGSGASYYDSPAMDPLFGRYYTWTEAQTACPDGWHLPTEAEFVELANSLSDETFSEKETFSGISGDLMVNASFYDELMWEFWPIVKITNKSGLNVIPVGYATEQLTTSVRFTGIYEYAVFWIADSDDEGGYYRYMYVDKPDVLIGVSDKTSFRASVRCVKD